MKGDFSRDTFDKMKHYRRVLMQQGRVQVDADWNEQVSILLHYMQSLARDIIGDYGKVEESFKVETRGETSSDNFVRKLADKGFIISDSDKEKLISSLKTDGNFIIKPGHYYVDGLLCENDDVIAYDSQCGYPFPGSINATDLAKEINPIENNSLLVYIDVWERHIAWCEEASNSIHSMREAALGPYGPDTATRSRLVWQVKVCKLGSNDFEYIEEVKKLNFEEVKKRLQIVDMGHLYAIAPESSGDGLCAANPSAKYLGLENQLYRVEIHRPTGSEGGPTFKWSRDNGSLVFPIIEGKIRFTSNEKGNKMCVTLSHLGLDESKALKKGDWVEFVHENYVLQNLAEPLLLVEDICTQAMEVTLVAIKGELPDTSSVRQPILRKWNQRESTNPEMNQEGDININLKQDDWVDLEDGIKIKFAAEKSNEYYRTGDYWLIPARVADKGIEWPDKKVGVLPHGVEHHFAPLAILKKNGDIIKAEETELNEIVTKMPLKNS